MPQVLPDLMLFITLTDSEQSEEPSASGLQRVFKYVIGRASSFQCLALLDKSRVLFVTYTRASLSKIRCPQFYQEYQIMCSVKRNLGIDLSKLVFGELRRNIQLNILL